MAENALREINRILGSDVLPISILLSFRILCSTHTQEPLCIQPNPEHNGFG